MKERGKVFEKLSEQVNKVATVAAAPRDDLADADYCWSRTILHHMKRMDTSVKDRFSVFVLQTAIHAVEGKWPK